LKGEADIRATLRQKLICPETYTLAVKHSSHDLQSIANIAEAALQFGLRRQQPLCSLSELPPQFARHYALLR
jgi:hypothetical protein